MTQRLPAINARVLTVVLLVALPVLVVGTAIVISIGQSRLHQTQSVRLAQVAEYTAAAVDAYVFRRILDASILARVPEIRRAAAEGNTSPFDPARTLELDQQWQADQKAASTQSGLLANPASAFLIDLIRHDPVYREILVTDRSGRLVAASNITSDYYQADESWWTQSFDDGRGRVTVTDVRRDDSAGIYAFEIAVPVPAPDREEMAGIVKIVADSREMLAGIGGLELGSTGQATLVRPDGSIVFSRSPNSEGRRYFAAELLRQRLEGAAQQNEPTGTIVLTAHDTDETRRLVAIAPTQLSRNYAELQWMVALSAEQDELLAPFRSLVWYLGLTFALTAIAVLCIALWFSLRLAAPPIDPEVDLHLVDHVPVERIGASTEGRT
ncbi:MAG TPA: cache domain-containing protein [Vicinamibacterales bacterium]|nr:cache domain-containing protein [Vicinamibacterales bacterium]